MRIGVDAREIQFGVVTGIGRSLANFIGYTGENESEHALVLFSESKIPIYFQGNVTNVVLKSRKTSLAWDQFTLPSAFASNKIDLFYSPYYKMPLFSKIPAVTQVLDLMYLVHPPYRSALGLHRRLYYNLFGQICVRKAINVISDSNHAKNEILRLWRIDSSKVTVIPLGVNKRYRPISEKSVLEYTKQKFKLPDRFILYLGNFKPHKNVGALVDAYKCIEKSLPQYKLVLAGPLDRYGREIQKKVSAEGLEERIIFTDTIREEDFPEAILTLSDLFVFPTLYEGFGIPPLEAMACGTPVIAGNLTAVPEVLGNAGVLVNPHDKDEIGKAICSLLKDDRKRHEYALRGLKHVQQFDEERTAGEVYRHLIGLLEARK
jgi:glycosyltransferase involved in cell wall biosynthesis